MKHFSFVCCIQFLFYFHYVCVAIGNSFLTAKIWLALFPDKISRNKAVVYKNRQSWKHSMSPCIPFCYSFVTDSPIFSINFTLDELWKITYNPKLTCVSVCACLCVCACVRVCLCIGNHMCLCVHVEVRRLLVVAGSTLSLHGSLALNPGGPALWQVSLHAKLSYRPQALFLRNIQGRETDESP